MRRLLDLGRGTTVLNIEVYGKLDLWIPCCLVLLIMPSKMILQLFQVWAAGFSTALLKKSSSTTYPSPETGGGTKGSQIKEKEPFFLETLLLVAFEKLFSYLLNLPDVNR